MLFTNLSVLLAERGLRISKVASDIGASRTTITALCNNTGQGVQFDTLNRLCTYLKITPAEFFIHIPYDYRYLISHNTGDNFDLEFTIIHGKSTQQCLLSIDIESDEEGFTAWINIPDAHKDDLGNNSFKKFFAALPPIAIKDLEEKILNDLWDKLNRECPASITWEI